MLIAPGMNLPAALDAARTHIVYQLAQCPGLHALPPPSLPNHPIDMRWHNTLFAGPRTRRAHVEFLEVADRFAVLHVCLFPHLSNPGPIFGFDMICGRATATGAFLDFSPATHAPPTPALREAVPHAAANFTQTRDRPAWGTIFSDDFLAIRPVNDTEAKAALALAHTALAYYLDRLPTPQPNPDPAIASGQLRYVLAQRTNPHTLRMLSRCIGEGAARRFIDDTLFPLPDAEK